MNNYKDYTGQKFGRLECMHFVARVGQDTLWECRCDCGTEVEVVISSVVSGGKKSCGCLKKMVKDHTGEKFGHLECLPSSKMVKGEVVWQCICDCGTFIDVKLKSLIDKSISSCGCVNPEPLKTGKKLKDYTGEKFGRLKCMYFVTRVERETIWKCKCDCGKIVDVNIRNVVSGGTRSCGCLKQKMSTKM